MIDQKRVLAYLERAEETRVLSDQSADAECKRILLDISNTWIVMAHQIERIKWSEEIP